LLAQFHQHGIHFNVSKKEYPRKPWMPRQRLSSIALRELISLCQRRVSIFRKYSIPPLRLVALVQLSLPMQSKTKERWLELCEQAAVEQDRVKLLELAKEINRLLQEKENRLAKLLSAKDPSNP